MPRASTMLFSLLLSVVFTACNTMMPVSSVWADPSISRSDVEAIERLPPVVGVRRPISGIWQVGPDKYSVTCSGRDLNESTFEYFTFTVYHRHGEWVADKSSVRRK